MTTQLGCGIDIGTGNLVSARQVGDKVVTNRIRDAFLDLEPEAKKQLRLSKVDFVDLDGQLVVIGDSALAMANLFKRDVRRPLSQGVISPGELKAQQIVSLLIKHVVGEPTAPGEHCFYSVPANPIDGEQDIIYHTEIFRKILTEQGYTAHPMNEAMAIIYSNCSDTTFSGLALSMGAGMANIALAYQTVKGLEFSLTRGGDFIDKNAAKAMGSTASRMCAIKEKGVDVAHPSRGNRDEEAIALYMRSLIRYCLENIAVQFRKSTSSVELSEPIPFVVSGGTSLAGGFLDVFKEEFEEVKKRGFPIDISEIRLARDPMTAVAEGLLVLALEEHAA